MKKTFKIKYRRPLTVLLASVVLITVVTLIGFFIKQNFDKTNRDRIVILAYQTNIGGSDGELWAKNLEARFDKAPGFEVSVFQTRQVGNESFEYTFEDGWSQIITRLAAGQGDILFVDSETFYSHAGADALWEPLELDFNDRTLYAEGIAYGVDITGTKCEGLLNLGTSDYVGREQMLPIYPLADSNSEQVIAVIYKKSTHKALCREIMAELFGGRAYEG